MLCLLFNVYPIILISYKKKTAEEKKKQQHVERERDARKW